MKLNKKKKKGFVGNSFFYYNITLIFGLVSKLIIQQMNDYFFK